MNLTKPRIAAASLLLLTAACNKSDSNGNTSTGNWSLINPAVSIKATSIVQTGNSIVAEGSSGTDGYSLNFSSLPTTTTTYKIVDYFKTPLAADEVSVEVDHGVSDVWLSTGTDNQKVTINVDGNKYNIVIENIGVRHNNSSGPQADTTTSSSVIVFYK